MAHLERSGLQLFDTTQRKVVQPSDLGEFLLIELPNNLKKKTTTTQQHKQHKLKIHTRRKKGEKKKRGEETLSSGAPKGESPPRQKLATEEGANRTVRPNAQHKRTPPDQVSPFLVLSTPCME